MNLDDFKTVTLSSGPSAITISNSGVSFSQTAVNRMGRPQFVKLMINRDAQMIAIKKTEENDSERTPFYNPKRKVVAAKWNYSELNNMITTMMNWDTTIATYKVYGQYYADDETIVFDLKEAKVTQKSKK